MGTCSARQLYAFCAVLVAVITLAPIAANAEEPAPVRSPTWLAARAQPAVQFLQIEYTSMVTVWDSETDWDAMRRVERQLHDLQRKGRIPKDLQGLNRYWLNLAKANPDAYQDPVRPEHLKARISSSCTAWTATPRGHLVTAAHCVKADQKELRQAMANQVLPRYIDKGVKETLQNFATVERPGDQVIPVDEDMLRLIRECVIAWFTSHIEFTPIEQTVQVALAVEGKAGTRALRPVPAKVLAAGGGYPDRDVAVLKIDGYDHLPSLALSDETQLSVGDTLYIDGFPSTVTQGSFTEESKREPTFTEGPVSAFRTTSKGVPYIQTQAPAYSGNSGGPVFDDSGRVIGILIAGAKDPDTGAAVAGHELVLPASAIAQELDGQDVRAVDGTVTMLYSAALGNYYRDYHTRALAGFTQVEKEFPQHPYAAHYAELARKQIAAGKDRTPPEATATKAATEPGLSPVSLIWLAVGIAWTVDVFVVSAFLNRRQRRRRSPAY